MSIKKSILAASALTLAVTAVVGGTFATEQDDATAVNIQTYGKGISVDIIEQQRSAGAGSALEDFEQGKVLYPIEGSAQGEKDIWGLPTAKNFVDKIVRVQNTGEGNAYVRFFFAIPSAVFNGTANDIIHTSWGNRFDATGASTYNSGDAWKTEWDWDYTSVDDFTTEINGENYIVTTFVYKTAVAPGEITDAPICGLYMDDSVDYDNGVYTFDGTPIDSSIFSNDYILPVFAQAVSADLADNALEAFSIAGMADNPWSDGTMDVPVLVETADELTNAVAEGGTVILTGEIIADNDDSSAAEKYSAITIDEDTTLDGNGTIENTGYAISVKNLDASEELPTLTINGGNYIGATSAVNVVTGNLVINGGFFKDSNTEDNGHYLINCIDANYKNGTATVTITGGTFVNWNPADNTSEGAGTNFLAPGYTVTSETQANGDVWYTVVAE